MINVYFKPTSASGATTLPAVYVYDDYEAETEEYTDLDWAAGVIIHASYKLFIVKLGKITTAQRDTLLSAKKSETVQFSKDNSTWYNVLLKDFDLKPKGAVLKLKNKAIET